MLLLLSALSPILLFSLSISEMTSSLKLSKTLFWWCISDHSLLPPSSNSSTIKLERQGLPGNLDPEVWEDAVNYLENQLNSVEQCSVSRAKCRLHNIQRDSLALEKFGCHVQLSLLAYSEIPNPLCYSHGVRREHPFKHSCAMLELNRLWAPSFRDPRP